MIFWNTQGGRVYPQSSGLSNLIARIFENVQVIGTGAWTISAADLVPSMSGANLNPTISGASLNPIMTGADI